MKEHRFVESDWDYCLVLDACRFDVFSEVYDDYVEGELEKRESLGSSTPEWAYRTLSGDHDFAYFSGNPFINSLGIPLNELKWGASCNYEWTASEHISEVVDVWKHGWDDELGTVPPQSLRESMEDNQDIVESADRTVLHYMQPHAPYLEKGSGGKLGQIREGIKGQAEAEDSGQGKLAAVGDRVRPKVESFLEGSQFVQKAGLWLELEPADLLRNGTRETAMEYYEQNLRIAFEDIAGFIDDLKGDVIITADHGEAFGEEGVWEHHIETPIPPLIEVPWLEVESTA